MYKRQLLKLSLMAFRPELTVVFRLFIPLETAVLISDIAVVTVFLMLAQLVVVLLLTAVQVFAMVFLMTPIAVALLFFMAVKDAVIVLLILLHWLAVLDFTAVQEESKMCIRDSVRTERTECGAIIKVQGGIPPVHGEDTHGVIGAAGSQRRIVCHRHRRFLCF